MRHAVELDIAGTTWPVRLQEDGFGVVAVVAYAMEAVVIATEVVAETPAASDPARAAAKPAIDPATTRTMEAKTRLCLQAAFEPSEVMEVEDGDARYTASYQNELD